VNEPLVLVFTALMGLAILAYVVLDGYDLGVGMLMPAADRDEQQVMVNSIGPFWDANETWLVLGIGLLLVAFPAAHGVVLGALYLPVAAMLVGLMLRGVAFEFRIKAEGWHRELWNWLFWAGSFLAAFAQGLMLGRYITGFAEGFGYWLFAIVVSGGVCGGYVLLGATWLVLKSEGELVFIGQERLEAVRRRGGDLRAVVRGPRLQPVPVRGDGPPDDLGSRGASERAQIPAGRNGGRAAVHPWLHLLRVPRVPRQGQGRRHLWTVG
jgi:cytochrome d oxidase subunit CydB